MKIRAIVLLASMLVFAPVLCQAQAKGDTATVATQQWVEVKNPQPVKSGNGSFAYGDSALIQPGGTLEVIGFKDDCLVVRYKVARTQYGTCAPSGIVFFISKEKFSTMTEKYKAIQAAEKIEKESIQRMLDGK